LKLKKLFVIEIAAIVVVIAVLLLLVEVSPFLASSKPNSSVAVYDQKEFAKSVATLTRGQRATVAFNYSTYDPSILVLNILFQSWKTPGNLSIYCNVKLLTTIFATPEKSQITLNVVSLSGLDWVDSPNLTSPNAINRIIFVSDENGYEGTFSYELYIRGSR
jgi:hypothetical protein